MCFVQQNERTICFYKRVCAMRWYLPIQTSARAGSMPTTPAVPIVLCKGTVMCCLETPALLRILILVPRSEMKRNSYSVHLPLFFFPHFSSFALQMFLVGMFSHLSSLPTSPLLSFQSPKQALMSNIFIHFPCIYMLAFIPPSMPLFFLFFKRGVKLVHHNTLTKWILHFSLILRRRLESRHSLEIGKIKGDGN